MTITAKVKANYGDNVRFWIETPDYVFDVSYDVNESGTVEEIGHGHLLIKNETDADLKIAVDDAMGEQP